MAETLLDPRVKKTFLLGLTNYDWSTDGNQLSSTEAPGADIALAGVFPTSGVIPAFVNNNFKQPLAVSNYGWWKGGTIGGTKATAGIIGVTQTARVVASAKGGQSVTAGTGFQLMTPSAGVGFNLTSLWLNSNNAAVQFEIRDSTSLSGTILIGGQSGASGNSWTVGQVPIRFVNGMFIDVGSNTTINYTIVGWED